MENKIDYMVADIDGKCIFLQEYVWALHNGLIPDDKLISHIDGDALNNDINNLQLVDENKKDGDLHEKDNKVFHVSTYNPIYVEKHFNDVFQKLNKLEIKEINLD